MRRFLVPALVLLLACGGGPVLAHESLEAEVLEIERLAVTAHWGESDRRIAALAPRVDELSELQRRRIEFVRLRNLGLAGDQPGALAGFEGLLQQELPAELRLRVYTTAISIAANVEDWTLAFTWLSEGLSHLPEAPEGSPGLLGVASYLHSLVGETGKARDLALQALALVEEGDDARALCLALADAALAEDHAGNFAETEIWRHRQVEACARAGDLVFIANARYGLARTAARQGRHAQALEWSRQALSDFEAAGFAAGGWGARLVLAESLIESGRGLDEAQAVLSAALDHYREQGAHLALAEAETLMSRLAERRGDDAGALEHMKLASAATAAAERDARKRRLAYMQVEFDTRLKEHQIALLKAEKELAALQVTATKRRQLLLAVAMVALLAIAVLLSGLLRRAFQERRRYRWQSERDGLTGLYNYQQVRKLGEVAYARAREAGKPFTAIVADIDLFKQVNDRYGHAAGDETLRALGAWITAVLDGQGIAGRSGGDEFTILLEADEDDASALLQRLRERIEPITVFGQTFAFQLSAGVCQHDGSPGTLEQLIHKADQALYRAKHAGRDRVVCANAAADAGVVAGAGAAGDSGPRGGLVVVGSGIQFGRHVTERALSEIREAEVVFCLVDPFALGMIRRIRPDAVNLGLHYRPGRDRREVYRAIDGEIMAALEAGQRVCAVFYGHPGVFADVPHAVLRKAGELGVPARMEPGISAEACLYADLGLDPGRRGVQSLEATHFLVHDRRPDTRSLVLLWQVALSGDLSCTRLHAEPEGVQALVDKLLRWYPPEHEVILYEAAQLPIASPRIERLALAALAGAHFEEYTTLAVPPLDEPGTDPGCAAA